MNMNEDERNQLVIEELDNLVVNAYEQENLNFNPDVIIDGKSYYFSPAQQLSSHICKKTYKEFRLTQEWHHLSATVYLERIIQEGGYFTSTKYAPKQCIGVLIYDIDKNRIILRKTNVNTDIHEFHKDEKRQMNECFGVSYEIFKYLRDNDLIQIHTIERKVRHQQRYTYTISKLKAVRNGRFLHFKGYGIQFFIPKADFKCVEGEVVKNKRKAIEKENKKKK